jgi:hypothetical protein
VQYPHWKASLSMKACCMGCISPFCDRPSIVVIALPGRQRRA